MRTEKDVRDEFWCEKNSDYEDRFNGTYAVGHQ